MAEVTVILPTRNRASYLPAAINSVYEQKRVDIDLVIVNDGSKDETDEVLRGLVRQERPTTVIRFTESVGIPRTLNTAVGQAKTDYVFIMSDRLVLKEDCVAELRDTLLRFTEDGMSVAAVGPRLAPYEGHVSRFPGYDSSSVVTLGTLTGEIYHDFSIDTARTTVVQMLHQFSLMNKKALDSIGGFNAHYQGNYWRVEAEAFAQLSKRGFRLLYNPRAVAFDRPASKGGDRLPRWRRDYFVFTNHARYLAGAYGPRIAYMLPFYSLAFLTNPLLARRRRCLLV